MSRKMMLMLTIAVLFVSAWIGATLVKQPWKKSAALSEKILQQKVLEQYAGEIVSSRTQGGSYYVELDLDTGRYGLSLDSSSGIITSIERLTEGTKQPEPSPAPTPSAAPLPSASPASTPPPKATPTAKPTVPVSPSPVPGLTKDEAAKAALARVPGEVQKVKRGDNDDYLVEIELTDGREAVVQVHRISGKVLSVTWDDDDDQDQYEAKNKDDENDDE